MLSAGEGLNNASTEVQGKFTTFEINLLCCAVLAVLTNFKGAFFVWYRLVICKLYTSCVCVCVCVCGPANCLNTQICQSSSASNVYFGRFSLSKLDHYTDCLEKLHALLRSFQANFRRVDLPLLKVRRLLSASFHCTMKFLDKGATCNVSILNNGKIFIV